LGSPPDTGVADPHGGIEAHGISGAQGSGFVNAKHAGLQKPKPQKAPRGSNFTISCFRMAFPGKGLRVRACRQTHVKFIADGRRDTVFLAASLATFLSVRLAEDGRKAWRLKIGDGDNSAKAAGFCGFEDFGKR